MIIRSVSLVLPGASNTNAPAVGIDSYVTTSNVATTTADASYPVTNIANDASFLEWRGTSNSAENITITISAGLTNYVGIAKHNFSTAGRSVKIQGDTGTGFADLTTAFTPADNSPLLFLFDSAAYTSIRVVLGAGSAVARAAVLYVGPTLALERNIYVGHVPITLGREARDVNGMSESGNFLGRIILSESNQTGIELTELSPLWVRGNLQPFLVSARTRPFFWGWRPDTYPYEMGYVWLTNNPKPVNSRPNGFMAVSMSVRGIV